MAEARQQATLYTQRTKSQKSNQLKQLAVMFHRVAAYCFAPRSPLFEIALVPVRFDHIASRIVKANHSIM
jgi:hypothetical protein